MVSPKLSVIVPLYNNEKEIGACLNSIFNSDFDSYEVIVIDDCSKDNSLKIAKKFPCRFFSTVVHSGAARARNIGVSHAKADIVLFFDSDTKVKSDALRKMYETFKSKKDMWAVIGVPAIKSLRSGRAPNYNALRNHFTLFSANPYSNYFTSQVGAVRKKVFKRLGGFDERFTGADVEDIEFGMRIPKGKIFINKEVIVWHHLPHFRSILKKYFRRAILLSDVVRAKKKLSNAHANLRGTASVIAVMLSLFILFISFFYLKAIQLFIFPAVFFIAINIDMFVFAAQKRGFIYFFEAIFFEYIFSIAIGFGMVVGTARALVMR